MHIIDKNFYPGWVRKSMTFTIDDGNLRLDKKFLDYVKPAGIKGTFNLCGNIAVNDVFPALYDGYEIGNHCRMHANAMNDERRKILRDELFDANTADPKYGYRTETEGLYRYHTYAWIYVADDDLYLKLARECQENLVSIFGDERVKGFIWPCGWQNNLPLWEKLKAEGYHNIRATGCVKDTNGFSLPADLMHWSFNSNYTCMKETGEQYEAYPDDGQLKFYCFGVHSHDFENAGRWDVLEDFCDRYGNRPCDFWYACVGGIFDYAAAVEKVIVTDEAVVNPTGIDLYITVDGKRVSLRRRSEYKL